MATIIITENKEELNILLNIMKINKNVNEIVANDKPKRKTPTTGPQQIFERNKTDIIDMINKRISFNKIAKHYGMSVVTFRKYLNRDSSMTNIRPPRKHQIKGVQQKLGLQ